MTTDNVNDNLDFEQPPNLEPNNNDDEIIDETPDEVVEPKQDEVVTLALDPKDISGSLDKLMREQPDVLNVVNSLIGNKARNKYQPRISELELELEAIRAKDNRSFIDNMPADELAENLKSPQFAEQYSQTMSAEDVLTSKRQQTAILNRIGATIDQAQTAGLSTVAANSIMERLSNGEFDTDGDGNMIEDAETAFANLNTAIYAAMRDGTQVVAPSTNRASIADVEATLDEATPDVSSSGSTSSTGPSYSIDEVNKMNPLEFERVFPNDEDFDNAVKAGRITGLSYDPATIYER